MLHLLIHMDRLEGPITSDVAANILNSNPVVVRRTMAGLRDAGHVRSAKGNKGGWSLNHGLGDISMLDVYRAVGEPRIFSIGLSNPEPQCLVEKAVNASMSSALLEAEALLIARLAKVTLADIARDFDRRMVEAGVAHEDYSLAHGLGERDE